MQQPIESLNLQMLNVGLANHQGDWNWQNVSSPFTRIYLVISGSAVLHLNGKAIPLRPGHLYMVPAYTVHSYQCDGPFLHYYLHIYEGVKSEMNVMEQYDFPAEVEACDEDEHILRRLCQQYPEARLPESNPQTYDTASRTDYYVRRYHDFPLWQKMELRGAMLILFSRFVQQAVPRIWTTDHRMQHVLTYIHTHIGHPISIDHLASIACISKPYFIRLFRHESGLSPVQYINRKKVERAQLLLYTTDLSVKQIAYALGFIDYSYFVRLFRKTTGHTPQEYRESLR